MNARPRKLPTTRRGFLATVLALALATGGTTSAEVMAARKRGYRAGKHNGRNKGAFGRLTAKAHRLNYVSATPQGGR